MMTILGYVLAFVGGFLLGYALGKAHGLYQQEVARRKDIEAFAGVRRHVAPKVAKPEPEPEEVAVSRALSLEADAEREALTRHNEEIVGRMAKDFEKGGLSPELARKEAERIVKSGLE